METTIEHPKKPLVTIRPGSDWSLFSPREIWQYRDLLFTLTERDMKLRYRQTAFGVIWILAQPLMAAGIFSLVFGRFAKMPSDGGPYILLALAGTLGWNAFVSTLLKSGGSLIGNRQLITKVYFPRVILPFSTAMSTVIDFCIALCMVAVLMVVYHVPPTPTVLLLPIWFLLLVTMGVGFGLLTSALVVKYRDVSNFVNVMTMLLMYASPVGYSFKAVPEHLRSYYFLNPLAGLLEAFRASLLGRTPIPWMAVGYAAIMTLAVFAFGAWVFKKMERGFADVI
jgi:lipopolysaccharide transport system permease protein